MRLSPTRLIAPEFHIEVAFDAEPCGGAGEVVGFQVGLRQAEIVVVGPPD